MIANQQMNTYLEKFHGDMSQFYADLQAIELNCVTTYDPEAEYSISELFRLKKREVIGEIETMLLEEGGDITNNFFDSILLQVTPSGSSEPITLAQDVVSFDCLNTAVGVESSDSFDFKQRCSRTDRVVQFQLEQDFAQDIIVSASAENKIGEAVKIGHKVRVSDVKSLTSIRNVGSTHVNTDFAEEYDTIYSVYFAMDPRVLKRKEIWLVQDEEEARTSTIMNLMERVSSAYKASSIFGVQTESSTSASTISYTFNSMNLLEFLAYVGGLWFFITQMVLRNILEIFFIDK